MSRSGVRGRRTRVYDCNYDMGESYYKSAIDRLDRKGRPEPEPPAAAARQLEDRYARAFADEDLNSARRRAEKVISEETLFDSRGGRAARGRPLSAAMEEVDNDFDDEVSASLRRLRANKKKTNFADDMDMESTVANLQSRSRLGLADKILESAGLERGERSELTRRTVRVASSSTMSKEDREGMTRWTALEDGSAAVRARQSRARLSDLEDESAALQQRQVARERRAAGLRALIAENESDKLGY